MHAVHITDLFQGREAADKQGFCRLPKIQMEQQPAIGQSAAMLPVEDQASRNAAANFSPQAINKSIEINGTSDQRNYAVDPRNRQALV